MSRIAPMLYTSLRLTVTCGPLDPGSPAVIDVSDCKAGVPIGTGMRAPPERTGRLRKVDLDVTTLEYPVKRVLTQIPLRNAQLTNQRLYRATVISIA